MTGPAPVEPEIVAAREQPGGIDIDLVVPPEAYCLQGHFPSLPVVPGVAQIDWAVTFADRYLGTAIGGATDFRVKFRSVLRPAVQVTLSLRRVDASAADGRPRLTFEYRSPERLFSTGSIRLASQA